MLTAIPLEPFDRGGELDRIEVLSLDVLDERDLEHLPIGDLTDDRRDGGAAEHFSRPESTLARDDFVAARWPRPKEERLEKTLLSDRLRELLDLLPRERFSRLMRVRGDRRERDIDDLFAGRRARLLTAIRQERAQPPAQHALRHSL